jgi:3',5'-cyclic-AMP phosphodiesterase
MADGRIAGLLSCVALAGCLDPTGERTRRDLEQTGFAQLGGLVARIDQGVALRSEGSPPFVRFRANAPSVVLEFHNPAGAEAVVQVELVNAFEDSDVSVPAQPVGSNALGFEVTVPAQGQAQVTVRPPGVDMAAPFRFAWVGDVQGGNERFTRVRERINADSSFDFVLFAGDITNAGTQEEIDEFIAVADGLQRPWYTLLGNHEALRGEPLAFQRTVGRINVRFDHRGARFVLLDSASATVDPWAWDWVGQAMEAEGPRTRIVATHVPPLDPAGLRDGGFNDRNEAARLLEMLARGGTDLLLTGHVHTLKHAANAGIQTWVSGNGGVRLGTRFDGSDLHYLSVSVDPEADRVDVQPLLVP